MRGIYVHVPFCVRKCAYCDFYSVAAGAGAMAGFSGLLVGEMELFLREYPVEAAATADSVFFGGGTPTALGSARLVELLAAVRARFPVAEGAETTTEANPGTVSAADFSALRAGGFDRVSIGVQSFDPASLATLGRIHGAAEIDAALRGARAAGFRSIGIDLIFGIPGQTRASFAADLDRAAALGPSHVSAYALAPEPGTPLHAAVGRGELRMPPDDAVAEMYGDARRILASAGLRQYEISNFARPGAECRHNLKYWRREGYRGFGPAAHGLIFPGARAPWGLRTANPPSLAEYGRRIRQGRAPWTEGRACDRGDAWKEALIVGLRETAGVDAADIERKIGAPPPELRDAVTELVATGRLLRDGSRLRLPESLLFVSNEVLQRLA
ncbi:MAG: radical SAM family heme chaperone HemW [Gemmatimonadota bacterium]